MNFFLIRMTGGEKERGLHGVVSTKAASSKIFTRRCRLTGRQPPRRRTGMQWQQSNMAADSGMETCPSPEMPDSRKRPLDSEVENGTTKRSHYGGGKYLIFITFNMYYHNLFMKHTYGFNIVA